MKDFFHLRHLARHGLAAAVLVASTWASASSDLADVPLGTMTDGTAVRSNLMFILDDSGSMGWNYLPDNAPRTNVCFGSRDRNFVFFDPTKTYLPPLKADGTPMPNANFAAAWRDGFNPAAGTVDLRNNNPETPSLAGTTLSSTTTTANLGVCGARNSPSCNPPDSTSSETNAEGNVETTTITYRTVDNGATRCRDNRADSCQLIRTTTFTVSTSSGPFLWAVRKPAASTGSCNQADFEIVRYSSALSPADLQNYANWFSYYRTRMLAMRSGVGRAFATIDASRFRVGYSTISETGVADNSRFLNIKEFDAGTHKQDFFDRLYAAQPNGWTPLRPALEKAGRYFANKVRNQTVDPMQYSCQRNYTILSTDGYWNTNAEGNYRSGYVPWKLDNTELGNVDAGSSVPRPMRDEVGGGGVGNTLADIAYYFYNTDLRSPALGNCSGAISGQDVCENNVPDGILRPPALSMLSDTAKHQHMTTFTIGLGVSGTLAFDPNYESQTSGDFYDLRQGSKVWPNPITNTGAERIDDLWHAAVNGRGTYYSANDAAQLAQNLTDAMKKIEAIVGSASAAATSSLTPSSGDDWLFVPLYSTKTWDGTVNAFKINTATGEKTSETPLWSASDRISTQSSRTIYFRSGGSLASFEYGNLSSAQKGYFDGLCASGAEKLTQCASLSATAKAKVTGTNVVNYLRGVKTYETSATAADDQLFRKRDTALGDIVNGAPVYVKKPPFKYKDDGYADFVAANAGRQAVLYVGANDGMLHAIKVDTVENGGGTELWAYVPSMVMPHMHVLADTAYESKHRFYVDGAPVVADVQDADGNWRTILVGGLGKGGRGYYALDVTNPTSPKSLWEYTDEDLGFTYGNPLVTKNKDGRWIVAFSSGYNNVSPGDGKGYLYVLDAVTGAKIKKIGTGVGSTSAPSNLGKINAWVDDQSDNVALRIYGADMLGNVWRFDFDDNLSGDDAFLLGTTGTGQPITTKPVLSEVVAGAYKYAVVTVATGRYLGLSDIGDDTVQSIYSFKDDLSTTGLGNLRSNPGMVKQTLKSDRSGLDSPATVTWASQKGWYIDLSLSEGERVNVDFDQQMNQLIVASNIPKPSVCAPGGTSWLYYFDIANGKVLLTYEGGTLVAGITTILSSTGKLITLVQGVDGRNTPRQGAEPSSTPSGTLRRTSWRELVD